jgi:hypothetical protein
MDACGHLAGHVLNLLKVIEISHTIPINGRNGVISLDTPMSMFAFYPLSTKGSIFLLLLLRQLLTSRLFVG